MTLRLCLGLVLLMWPAKSWAQEPGAGRMTLQLDASASRVEQCRPAKPELDENQQSLVVAFSAPNGAAVKAPFTVRFSRAGQALGSALEKGKASVLLSAADLSGAIQITAEDGREIASCDVPKLDHAADGGAPAAASAGEPPAVDASIVAAARAYLADKHITDHPRAGRRITLYHLPDGHPAFPIPAHLSEADRLRLVVVAPAGARAEFAVTSCEDVPGFRIAGSFAAARSRVGLLQSGELQEIAHDVELSCSGTLSYEVRVGLAGGPALVSRAIAIRLEPVYRFSWGIALVFDFGAPPRLGLGDRPSGDGSEKFITRDSSLSGVRPLISLTFHPWAANPRNWRLCNAFNLFLALDPTRMTEGFAAGLNLKPAAEIGLLVGLSVFQSQKLADGVSERPGDSWSASGGLPTKKVFDKDSLGLLLGVEVSLELLTSLLR